MMSAVKVTLSNRDDIPLPAASSSTKQLCPEDDRSYTWHGIRGACCCRARSLVNDMLQPLLASIQLVVVASYLRQQHNIDDSHCIFEKTSRSSLFHVAAF